MSRLCIDGCGRPTLKFSGQASRCLPCKRKARRERAAAAYQPADLSAPEIDAKYRAALARIAYERKVGLR